MMSCKSDDISPTSPKRTEGKLNISELEPIISQPISVIDFSNSTSIKSFDNNGEHPMVDIVCTGLSSDNLTLGYPQVNEEDTVDFHGITGVMPIPKKRAR